MRALKFIGIIIVVAAMAAGGYYFGFRAGSAQAAAEPSGEAAETLQELSWKDLYAGVLRTYINPEYPDSGFAMFNIFDLDGDGSPELLVSDGDYHMASAQIFTLYRGAVYCLGSFGSNGEFQFDPETGHIYSEYSNLGVSRFSIHKIADGELIDIASFYDTSGHFENPEDGSFVVNSEEVSEDEYNREREKYGNNPDDEFTVRKYSVNEDEIARVFANY